MGFFLFLGLLGLFAYVSKALGALEQRSESQLQQIEEMKRRLASLESGRHKTTPAHDEESALPTPAPSPNLAPKPKAYSIVAEQEEAEERARRAKEGMLGSARTPAPPPIEQPDSASRSPSQAEANDASPGPRFDDGFGPGSARDVENFFGGRVMLVVGVVVALLGVGFFLHLAIERGWLGPAARLGLTITAGLAAIAGGEILRKRGFANYGSALTGGGIGALFLASHFAANVYEFISTRSGFLGGAIVAAFSAWLGIRRRNPFLVHLGFAGAWIAPYVFGKPTESVLPLAAWLITVDLGVLAVRTKLRYPVLDLLSTLASFVYLGGWMQTHLHPTELANTAAPILVAMALRAAILIVPVFTARLAPEAIAILAGLLGAVLTVGLNGMLFLPDHRTLASIVLASFAGTYFGAARLAAFMLPETPKARHAFTALGVFFLAVAIPHGFRDIHIATAYAACGGALAVLGCEYRNRLLRNAGLIYLGLAALTAFGVGLERQSDPEFLPVLNGLFLARFMPTIAAFVAAYAMHRTATTDVRSWVRAGFVAIAGHYYFLLTVALEIERMMLRYPDLLNHITRDDGTLLTSFAFALIALGGMIGFRRYMPGLHYSPALPFIPAVLTATPVITELHLADFHPLVNASCLYGLLLSGILFGASRWAQRSVAQVLRGTGIVFAIVTLTMDLYFLGEFGSLLELTRSNLKFFSQVAISVLWSLCAVTLLKVGFARESKAMRMCGLALFAITAGKVFLSDLESLDLAWRAASFLGLGVLLVLGSYLYQRKDDGGVRPPNPT